MESATLQIAQCEFSPDCYEVRVQIKGLDFAQLRSKADKLSAFRRYWDEDEPNETITYEALANQYSVNWLIIEGDGIVITGVCTANDPEDHLDGTVEQTTMSLSDQLAVVDVMKKLLAA